MIHLLWQNKITWSELIVAATVYKVNKDPNFTLGDALAITSGAIAVGSVWAPELRVAIAGTAFAAAGAPAAAVLAPVAVGTVASGAIAGSSGIKTFNEFLWEGGKWEKTKFTAKTLKKHKIDPMMDRIATGASVITNAAVNEVERRYESVKFRAERGADWFLDNRKYFLTGPYLPF